MNRHFCIVIGDWMFRNWHLYRWREFVSARNSSIRRVDWDKVF